MNPLWLGPLLLSAFAAGAAAEAWLTDKVLRWARWATVSTILLLVTLLVAAAISA